MDRRICDPIRQGLMRIILLVFLAWIPSGNAAPLDKSDLNNDGAVDALDLEIFSDTYLEQDWETVDWCLFYESSIENEKYFRKATSERTATFTALLNFITEYYSCQATPESEDKSDLNGDLAVDLADLIIFSTNYLERNWETVDWCVFYESTVTGEDFEGQSTKYYLRHFGRLLIFIDEYFYCNGEPPLPPALLLENAPKYPGRVVAAGNATGDFYVTDPVVGSLFFYDADLALKAEIKGLNSPLGVAVDAQGRILVGNDGRDNIEIYDPATGDLLAVFGEGVVNMPTAITIDELGNIYVTDSLRHVIQVFDTAYNPVRTIGRFGIGPGELEFPTDAEIIAGNGGAGSWELFVADQRNFRIQVFDLQGNWLRSFGFGGRNCNWFTGLCDVPAFRGVQALATDSFGRLHVLDKLTATAVIFNPVNGGYLASYGEYGTAPGFLRLPIDVLVTDTDMAVVTSGNCDRI